MELQKTEKDILTPEDIRKFVLDYRASVVPELDKLWSYYKAKNVKILSRKTPDPNNPDNRVVVSYGRKIITTFTGYAYRPRYITYKANVEMVVDSEGNKVEPENPKETAYVAELQQVFDRNNEHIKTSRAGRNTGIFGLSYELLYIDRDDITAKAMPKFFTVDPREMILLYNYDPEPKPKFAIRFYKMDSPDRLKVEVYYPTKVELYVLEKKPNTTEWIISSGGESYVNFFGDVPVVAYYLGDDIQSIMEPVLSLIDAYDVLFSDSMNEFDRFAFAYLIMKKFGLTDPVTKKDPTKLSEALKFLKRRRVFEHLPADADIKFLTKDIPTAFIQWMATVLREQIHVQSHVPDFTSDKMAAGVSGIAIQRLMFDFENLVSSAEADFDVGLLRRIELITRILARQGRPTGTTDMVTISHKRNTPVNLQEFAQTSLTMKGAGFSSYLCADIWPDDIIPNVEEELERQKEEQESLMGGFAPPEDEAQADGEPITEEEIT